MRSVLHAQLCSQLCSQQCLLPFSFAVGDAPANEGVFRKG
jgi:hypothetical protein